MTDSQTRAAALKGGTWHETVLATLKSNDVKLITYVPDKVLTPLIKALHGDAFFTTFAATREEEAVGIVTGACVATACLIERSRMKANSSWRVMV